MPRQEKPHQGSLEWLLIAFTIERGISMDGNIVLVGIGGKHHGLLKD